MAQNDSSVSALPGSAYSDDEWSALFAADAAKAADKAKAPPPANVAEATELLRTFMAHHELCVADVLHAVTPTLTLTLTLKPKPQP